MKIKGIIKFSTDKGKNVEVQNNTTVLGDMYFKAKATRDYAIQRGVEGGFDFIQSVLVDAYNITPKLAGPNDALTVYLLNLSQQEIANLTAQSQLLPIYQAGTFDIDHSKIVGWASIDRTSTQAKQGIFTARAGENLLDEWIVSLAWNWEVGKALGSFNCIAIGLNVVNTNSKRTNGIAIYKGLENNDFQAGEPLPSGFMCRPGVSGITGANEILLGGTITNGKARVKYDLVAKTPINLDPTDQAYDFPLSKADKPQVVVGDKLYYWVESSNYLQQYDMTTKTHTQTSIQSQYKTILVVLGDYLYVASGWTVLKAYNKNTLAAVTSADINYANIKFPYDWLGLTNTDLSYIRIGNFGNSGIIITRHNTNDNAFISGVVMQDLTSGVVLGIAPLAGTSTVYDINNEKVFFTHSVKDELYRGFTGQTATTYTNFGTHGVKYSKWLGNMLSFKVFDTPQTIATDEVARVEYAYKYE